MHSTPTHAHRRTTTAGESRSDTDDVVVELDDAFVLHRPAFDLIGRLVHIAP